MADEPRWRGVEDAAQDEAAARRDRDDLLLVIGRPALGQRSERRPLQLDPLAIVGVAPANDLVDEAAVGIQIVEVTAATQEQRVLQRLLEMAVRAFDGAILVCDARVVPGRYHAVMAHQPLIALCQILLSVAVQVAECRREAIAAMLARHPAERPQRILQTLGQRDKALAAKHDVSMLEARERQPEVVEPMPQHDTSDRDAEHARVGEVGQAKPARLVLLAEDHILLGPDQRSPRAHAPLQRAPNAGGDLRMAPPDLFEHGDRPNAGRRLQDRHNLAVPNLGQRVRPPPATWRLLL